MSATRSKTKRVLEPFFLYWGWFPRSWRCYVFGFRSWFVLPPPPARKKLVKCLEQLWSDSSVPGVLTAGMELAADGAFERIHGPVLRPHGAPTTVAASLSKVQMRRSNATAPISNAEQSES